MYSFCNVLDYLKAETEWEIITGQVPLSTAGAHGALLWSLGKVAHQSLVPVLHPQCSLWQKSTSVPRLNILFEFQIFMSDLRTSAHSLSASLTPHYSPETAAWLWFIQRHWKLWMPLINETSLAFVESRSRYLGEFSEKHSQCNGDKKRLQR